MAATDNDAPMTELADSDGGGRWWRWLWLPFVLLVCAAAAVVAGLWYLSETPGGRALVARQVSAITLQSGLGISIGRIDGSLLSAFTLSDVEVTDLDGVLATIDRAEVRWQPAALLRGQVAVGRLEIPEIRMLRMWSINPRDPDQPILPDIDIRIDRFAIGALVLEEPVLGRPETIAATGRVDIADGRLLMDVQATAARGDRLAILVDAEPDQDRFDLDLDLKAPAGGLLANALRQDAPIRLSAAGSGSWTTWRGQLVGAVGEDRIVGLEIMADSGRFRITGDLAPASLLADRLAPLVSPSIAVDATVAVRGDLIDLKFVASAPAFALSGSGGVNLKDNRLDAVRADLLVRRPGDLVPDLEAAGLLLVVTADGAIADPALGWRVTADRIRLQGETGPIGVDGLDASGTVQIPGESRPLSTSFRATVKATAGLPPELAALVQRPVLTGTASYADGSVRLAATRLETARFAAGGDGVIGRDGSLTATVAGGAPRLEVDGLGAVAIRADARISRPAGEPTAVRGRFDVRTLSISNESAADFLGGPARMQGSFNLMPSGAIMVSGARFDSPQLTFVDGKARYDPGSGRFVLDIDGRSKDWGPIELLASGTADAPTATIRMASPGFGVGLTALVATISPTEGGIAFSVAGESPQGPLDGRGRLLFGSGEPLLLDLDQLRLAGVTASGVLTQTAAGPFTGTLDVAGQGVVGTIALSDRAGVQKASVNATARAARIPLATPIQISSGNAALEFLLAPTGLVLAGTFELSGVRRDSLVLNSASGKFALNDDRTVGRVRLAGRVGGGQPFATVLDLRSTPAGYAVMLDGTVGRTPIRLEQAAQIVRREGGGWEVQATRLKLPGGSLTFAGAWRDPIIVRLVLDSVDLSVLNGVSRTLGLTGTASGQVNIRWDEGYPVPLGAANLSIRNLDRAGIGGVSIPVDIEMSARSSTAEGVLIGGAIAVQGKQLGRMLVTVAPAETGDPVDRLLNGTLRGGVRYNGPVEPVWALTGLSGQELRGPIALAADVGGTLSSPTLVGKARGRGLLYRNAALGTEIDSIAFDGSFRGSKLEIASLTGNTAGGSISGSGIIDVNPTAGSIDLGLQLTRARVADSDTLSVTLSGPLQLKGAGRSATLSGDLRVDAARIQLVQLENSEIPQLQVRRAGDVRIPPREQNLSAANLGLDIRVVADDRIQVEGMGLDSLWRADMRIRGTAAQPRLVGTATLASGDFSFAGSRFDINSGRVVFNGAPMDSAITIEAETRADDVTAFVTIAGTAAQPEIRFRSSPALPEDEILARLLFGTSVAQLSVTEALQLATAVAGLQSGVDTMGKIRRSVGVDRLRLVGEDAATGMGTALAIGKRLTRNIYVEVQTDSEGNTLATLQWSLSRTLALLLEVSSVGNSSANLRYQREY